MSPVDLLGPILGWRVFALGHEVTLVLAALTILAWCFSEYLGRSSTWRQGAAKRPSSKLDRGTYPFIAMGLGGGLVVSALCFLFGLGPFFPSPLALLGLFLAAVGILVRLWAMRTLGKFFTMPITVRPDHRVVREGPYRWLRHPAYTGNFLIGVGLPLILGTVVGFALSFLFCAVVYVHRIRIEEGVLLQQLGEAYREYSRTTSRLLPRIY